MKKLLVFLVLLIVAVGALGYWRGWFSVTKDGRVDVQVDSGKFQQDKAAFSKTVGEKAKAMKDQVAGLWQKTEGLSGDTKVQAQKELGDLQAKHNRLELQISEIDDAGQAKFESIKEDLSKTLADVDAKIAELTRRLEKSDQAGHAPKTSQTKE